MNSFSNTYDVKKTSIPKGVKNKFFQPKLTINQPNDIYEQEADAVADKVMRMPAATETEPLFFQPKPVPVTPVLRKCTTCEHEEKLQRKEDEEDEEPIQLKPTKEFDIQRKCAGCEEEEKLQMKSGNDGNKQTTAPPIVHDVINSGGQPIDEDTRGFMESRFGYDFSNVQIHNDSMAHKSSADISALAYTHENHIVFGRGQYEPGTNEGKKLMAHELTHVVQQNNGYSGFMKHAHHTVQREAAEPGICDKNNLGTLGPMFLKPEKEVKKQNWEKRKLQSSVTDMDNFMLYCPHKASVALRRLIPGTTVHYMGSGKVSNKDEVWAPVENEEENLVWGFIKNSYYALAQGEKDLPEGSVFEELAKESSGSASVKAEYEAYAVNKMNTQGRMSSDANNYEDIKTVGKIIRSKPDPAAGEVTRIKYGELLFIRASDTTQKWLYVAAQDGRQGWTQRDFVAEEMPDSGAVLYHILDTPLENMLKTHYTAIDPYPIKTGDDLRVLALALYIGNIRSNGTPRGGISLDKDKLEADLTTSLKDVVDPWNEENRRVYRSIEVKKGHNIWFPGTAYVNQLKSAGVITLRPGWVNTLIDAGKMIVGFNAGMIAGFFGGIWDILKGLYELVTDIIDLVGKAFSGVLLEELGSLYDEMIKLFENPEKIKELLTAVLESIWNELKDFYKKWTAINTWDKWFFRGEVVGLICLEVVMFLLSGGAANAVKWIAKISKYAPKLFRMLQKLITKINDVIPGKHKKKGSKDKDQDSDNDKNRDKIIALGMAKAIAEVHDAKDSSLPVLMASLEIVKKKYKVVTDFRYERKSGAAGHYKIIMIASEHTVDEDYSIEPGKTPRPSKPSYAVGESDGGPGLWEKEKIFGKPEDIDFQKKVTGGPDDVEYVLSGPNPSGRVKFDGYDPARDVLLDAKRYENFPRIHKGKIIGKENILDEAKRQINSARNGKSIEWHIESQEKADLLKELFLDNNITDIKVIHPPVFLGK